MDILIKVLAAAALGLLLLHFLGVDFSFAPRGAGVGIVYTGKPCPRKDGTMGREGYLGKTLGCWKY